MYKEVASVTILGFFSNLTIAGITLGPAFLGLSCLMGFKGPCPDINAHADWDTKCPEFQINKL